VPRASTDTTPLPPPPVPGVAEPPPVRGVVDAPPPIEHPRAPSEWIADRVDAPEARAATAGSSAHRADPSAEEPALVTPPVRTGAVAPRKLLMIGGGVAALAVVAIIALTRGGSSKPHAGGAAPSGGSAVAVAEGGGSGTRTAEDSQRPPMQPPHGGHGSPAVAAASGSAADVATGSDETIASAGSAEGSDAATEVAAAPAPAPKHHPTLGGKQVVLEYDNATHAPPTPAPAPREDSAVVEKARRAYAMGNQRLFAGDAAGAVRAYQQALDEYPGYVAGYRGLGLAYAQQGDKAKALQAFHTYLANAPGARDAALIRKRVAALGH
jgi:hypothetical protein